MFLNVSCSVVFPALCHLHRSIEVSEDDPTYMGRFKAAFKKDLSERQANINNRWLKIASALDPRLKDLKFLPRGERDELWVSLQVLLQKKPSGATPQPSEEPAKKEEETSCFLLQTLMMATWRGRKGL